MIKLQGRIQDFWNGGATSENEAPVWGKIKVLICVLILHVFPIVAKKAFFPGEHFWFSAIKMLKNVHPFVL
jgi:hypothetical protein